MKIHDILYSNDSMFTRFMPNTKAGEKAFAEMAAYTDGTGKVLHCHAKSTIRQLRNAGYSVGHGADLFGAVEDDALLADLLA